MDRQAVVVGLLALAITTNCVEDTYTLTIHLRAELSIDTYDVRVWRQSDGEVIFDRSGQAVGQNISEPGQELAIDVEVPNAGDYVVLLTGRSSSAPQLAVRALSVSTQTDVDLTVVEVGGMDADGDGFISSAACFALDSPSIDCTYSDCDDSNSVVHPFAQEICGNNIDENCDGDDSPCP